MERASQERRKKRGGHVGGKIDCKRAPRRSVKKKTGTGQEKKWDTWGGKKKQAFGEIVFSGRSRERGENGRIRDVERERARPLKREIRENRTIKLFLSPQTRRDTVGWLKKQFFFGG